MCLESRNTNGMLKTLTSSTTGPTGADGDAGDLQSADLGLLDGFLLAAKLHGRKHLDGEPAAGGGIQLLAHADHGFDRGIAERWTSEAFRTILVCACAGVSRPRPVVPTASAASPL